MASVKERNVGSSKHMNAKFVELEKKAREFMNETSSESSEVMQLNNIILIHSYYSFLFIFF